MRSVVGTCLIVCFLSTVANAEDCDRILDSNLLDQSQVVDKTAAADAEANSFCNKTYKEMQDSHSLSGSGEYAWGFISGNGDSSESSFNSWKQENCGNSSSEHNADAYHYSAQRALSSQAIGAWRECKLNAVGLSCYAEPNSDPDTASVVLGWRPSGTREAKVDHSLARNAVNQTDPSIPHQLYARDARMYPGSDTLVFQREKPGSMEFSLAVIYGDDVRYTCNVFVPAPAKRTFKRVAASFNILGDWCPSDNMPALGISGTPNALKYSEINPNDHSQRRSILQGGSLSSQTGNTVVLAFADVKTGGLLVPDPAAPVQPGQNSVNVTGTMTFQPVGTDAMQFIKGDYHAAGAPYGNFGFWPTGTLLRRCH